MKHIIIGTAGHVDHGKTTLIKALTGTDTDRLKEEQERGMTIDLGFASLTLPDGTLAGIVDVPGHERFLKNMLAGAAGVDVVLMVIAADEGVMPQTVEHLEILSLLDVRHGVIALTKCDTVEADWLRMVEDDVRARLAGTFLAGAPIVRLDSPRGIGVPELKRALLSAASRAEPKNARAPFRLPVDRVFTRPGFGVVVTGTLVAGTLRAGDVVELQPLGLSARVRGLQSHGKAEQQAEAGMRVAVNLVGVEKEVLERGVELAAPGLLRPTQAADCLLRMLPGAPGPLKHRQRLRVHLGTSETLGRAYLLSADSIAPGARAYVQIRTEKPIACARGDRFVVRTYSPMRTVAGGIVLDPAPQRHRRNDPAVLERLAAHERGTPEDLVEAWLQSAPFGAAVAEGISATGLDADAFRQGLEALQSRGDASALAGDRIVYRPVLAALTERVKASLRAYHEANPLKPGMPKEELRAALGRGCEAREYAALLAWWQREGAVVVEGHTVRLADFVVQLNPRQQALYDRVCAVLRDARFQPPSLAELSERVRAPQEAVASMLRVGVDRGELVRIGEGSLFHKDTIEETRRLVRDYIEEHGPLPTSVFRDLIGSSRKYAVPLLEYLDAVRFTRRVGDTRVLGPGQERPAR